MSAHYSRALKLFIQCGDREIDAAIDVVGKSQSEGLTHQLIDFLVGEKDGVPKDPNYIYRLYMALKKYDDAAKTALIIARQEQDMGNYALAHSVVFETIRRLEDAGIKVILQLRQNFVLLHSYILSRKMISAGDDNGAARMLLRVAQSVSKFPQHVVPILTSTVIECHRAGLMSSAHEYAVMLMRPEYRSAIREDLKRQIESKVRRRATQSEEVAEDLSLCPISGQLIPLTQLECPTTRDALPMCVVTGRHMLLDDWCFCPVSKSPVLFSAYVKYIEASLAKDGAAVDPVLSQPVALSDLRLCKAEEATKYIRIYNNVFDEKKPEDENDEPASSTGDDGWNATGDVAVSPLQGDHKPSKPAILIASPAAKRNAKPGKVEPSVEDTTKKSPKRERNENGKAKRGAMK